MVLNFYSSNFYQGKYIVDFNSKLGSEGWYIVDDRVMGGRSLGNIESKEDHILFFGDLSLENNGGFSWAQFETELLDITSSDKITIRVKTDEHSFHFTAKTSNDRRFHYESNSFTTNGEWETLTFPLSEMKKTWRGRQFDDYLNDEYNINQLGLILKDKAPGKFSISIDKVEID